METTCVHRTVFQKDWFYIQSAKIDKRWKIKVSGALDVVIHLIRNSRTTFAITTFSCSYSPFNGGVELHLYP